MERIKRIELALLLSFSMGLLYALISQTINQVILNSIPLHSNLPSPAIMIAVIVFSSIVLGVVSVIPDSIIYGVLAAGILGGVFQFIKAFLFTDQINTSWLNIVTLVFSVFLPNAILFIILSLLLHWSINHLLQEYFMVNTLKINRILPILFLLLVAATLGGINLKNSEFRHDLRLVNTHLQQARLAESLSELPDSLRDVPGFFLRRKSSYELEASNQIDLFNGQPPEGVLEREKGIVVVHYEDHYTLTCLTIDKEDRVICEVFVPFPERED